MKTLKGQPIRDDDYADVRKQIEQIFYKIIFKPIVDLLSPKNKQVKDAAKELRNAPDDALIKAIRSGKVQYSNGIFSGEFNAAITKSLKSMGAKFNKQTKVFAIAPDLITAPVKAAADEYQKVARHLHEELEKALDDMEAMLGHSVDKNEVDATETISLADKNFKKSCGDALGNEDLTDESRARLKREYADSVKPYIKKFSADTIAEIRKEVEANALAGYRFDHLVERIQGRYDVSRSKAEFLARQETAMYVSKHRRVRFEESGVRKYVWRTAGGPRVREDHRKLNGRVFSYDDPPVVDEATGRKGNPGEDYNCRCVDEPVLPEVKQEVAA